MVTRLDRLGWSVRDLLNIIDAITKVGATFRSLSDPWADASSPHGKLVRGRPESARDEAGMRAHFRPAFPAGPSLRRRGHAGLFDVSAIETAVGSCWDSELTHSVSC
jgi:hypothetical protein